MKSKKSILLTLLAGVLVTTTLTAGLPPVPATPAAVDGLVYARPFTLAQNYEYEWSKEKSQVTEGYLVVLKVAPGLVYPRQAAEPVLYVGPHPAERINAGHSSGHVVAVVPGTVEKLDLAKALMWFGTPELPERVDLKKAKEERTNALRAGIKLFDEAEVAAALARGGDQLAVEDRYELLWEAAELIKQYAPDESDLVESLRIPRVEAAPADSTMPKPATAGKD